MRSGAGITGGEALFRSLAANGVQRVFGIPGVQLDHAADALYRARDHIECNRARYHPIAVTVISSRLSQADDG